MYSIFEFHFAFYIFQTLKPGGFSNAQPTQNLPSASIPSGPPLPQQLSVHPYPQPTLPLGPFSNLVGYPYLPQNYYLPSAAFQQSFSSNGPFHQSAATTGVPGVSMKYSMPQYKSSLPATSPPQPSSVVSGFGGFGSSNNIPGNFGLNQNVPSAPTTMGFEEALSTQFKDNSQYIALQQVSFTCFAYVLAPFVFLSCLRILYYKNTCTCTLTVHLDFHFIFLVTSFVMPFRTTALQCGFMELLVQGPFQRYHLATSMVSRARISQVASARGSSPLNTVALGTQASTSHRLVYRRSTRRTLLREP